MQKSGKFTKPRSRQEIDNIAASLRHYLGATDDLVIDMIDIIEYRLSRIVPNFKLEIMSHEEMGETEALTFKDPPGMRVREDIYIGAFQAEGRPRYTLAHELGHFFLHDGNALPRLATNNGVKVKLAFAIEEQADYFAASFLMPEHLVQRFESPDDVVEGFHVSSAAAIWRMKELNLWPRKKTLPDLSFLDIHRKS